MVLLFFFGRHHARLYRCGVHTSQHLPPILVRHVQIHSLLALFRQSLHRLQLPLLLPQIELLVVMLLQKCVVIDASAGYRGCRSGRLLMGLRGLSNSQGLLSLTRCLLALCVRKLGPRSGLIEVLQALLEVEQLSI